MASSTTIKHQWPHLEQGWSSAKIRETEPPRPHTALRAGMLVQHHSIISAGRSMWIKQGVKGLGTQWNFFHVSVRSRNCLQPTLLRKQPSNCSMRYATQHRQHPSRHSMQRQWTVSRASARFSIKQYTTNLPGQCKIQPPTHLQGWLQPCHTYKNSHNRLVHLPQTGKVNRPW